MGLEIEIKAHVKDEEVDSVLEQLKSLKNSEFLGKESKIDIYWAKNEDDSPMFRTRWEKSNDTAKVLFTNKPSKQKIYGTEINQEYEFEAPADQWDRIIDFVKAMNLKVCRKKTKEGYHFNLIVDNVPLHSELLYVKYLGWFLETEMTDEAFDSAAAEKAILKVLDFCKIDRERIEPTGYNKMLTAVGHEKG